MIRIELLSAENFKQDSLDKFGKVKYTGFIRVLITVDRWHMFLMKALMISKLGRQEFTACPKKGLFLEYTTEMSVPQ